MNKILNETEEHFKGRVTREQIKEAFDLLFKNSADLIRGYMFPTITFPKFGNFRPKIKGLETYSKNLEKYEDREEDKANIEKAINRLKEEKQKTKRKKS